MNACHNLIVEVKVAISHSYGMTTAIIRGLEIFCALIEERSATAAARRLGMSQPAVSQQIARLESDLDLPLFVRENGRMRPTETALSLYEEATHAFDGLDRVMNLARDIRRLERGLLRVAAPHSMGDSYLPRALKRLTEGHPHLRIQVHLGTYERIISLVAAREVDIAVAKAPILSPGVDSIEICKSGLVAVMLRTNPLAGKAKLQLADLSDEPLIMIGRARNWRDAIDVAFRREGVAMRVAVETQSVTSAIGFAANGFGTAIVPAWLAHAHDLPPSVMIVPFEIGVEHQFLVAYPARSRREGIAADFAAAFAQLMGGAD